MNKITFKSHFPSTKEKWKIYVKVFFPIFLGSVLFAMNNFVDNFMVGGVSQGTASLSSANAWSNIIMGILAGSAASGSVIMAQYYFAGNFEQAQKVSRLRFTIGMFVVIVFFILAQTMPGTLAKVFLHEPLVKDFDTQAHWASVHEDWNTAIEGAKSYLRIISFSWILISFTFNYGNQLREIGHAKASMQWAFGTITTNIALNSILIYWLDMGVVGAAYASVAARCVALFWGIVYSYIHKLPTNNKPWEIFLFDWFTVKLFFKRWLPFVTMALTNFFITFRSHFYDAGYPVGTIADGVGAMLVLGLTGAIMNVFTTTFNALSALSANFVASEQGKGNMEQAKANALELKGFTTLTAIFFSLLLVGFASLVPYMSFFSHADGVDNLAHLQNVRNTLYVIAFWYPIWIWFSASYRAGLTGGKGSWFSFVDFFISGLQVAWAALVMTVFVDSSTEFWQSRLWLALFIFYASDLIKLAWQEWLFYRFNWLENITEKEAKVEKNISLDDEDKINPN